MLHPPLLSFLPQGKKKERKKERLYACMLAYPMVSHLVLSHPIHPLVMQKNEINAQSYFFLKELYTNLIPVQDATSSCTWNLLGYTGQKGISISHPCKMLQILSSPSMRAYYSSKVLNNYINLAQSRFGGMDVSTPVLLSYLVHTSKQGK